MMVVTPWPGWDRVQVANRLEGAKMGVGVMGKDLRGQNKEASPSFTATLEAPCGRHR